MSKTGPSAVHHRVGLAIRVLQHEQQIQYDRFPQDRETRSCMQQLSGNFCLATTIDGRLAAGCGNTCWSNRADWSAATCFHPLRSPQQATQWSSLSRRGHAHQDNSHHGNSQGLKFHSQMLSASGHKLRECGPKSATGQVLASYDTRSNRGLQYNHSIFTNFCRVHRCKNCSRCEHTYSDTWAWCDAV